MERMAASTAGTVTTETPGAVSRLEHAASNAAPIASVRGLPFGRRLQLIVPIAPATCNNDDDGSTTRARGTYAAGDDVDGDDGNMPRAKLCPGVDWGEGSGAIAAAATLDAAVLARTHSTH
jgi:hypothetical protein